MPFVGITYGIRHLLYIKVDAQGVITNLYDLRNIAAAVGVVLN
jgi:hypothetical protein